MKQSLEQRQAVLAAIPEGKSSPSFLGQKLGSKTFYIAGIGTAISGLGELILPTTNKAVGVTNFPDGNRLPAGTNLVVYAARILVDNTTSSVTPLIADWADKATPALLNSEIHISQVGQGNLISLPVTELNNIKASTGNDADFHEFVPFAIRSGAEFSIILEKAGTVAATEAWRLELRCDVYGDPSTN